MYINKSIFRVCLALFIIAAILLALPTASALAFTTGPKNAGLGENVAGVGTSAWDNPNNITAPIGGDPANVLLKKDFLTSNYLRGTNYGFDLPPDATIHGIEVTINRQSSGNNPSIVDNIVSLVTTVGLIGENKAYTTTWTTSMSVATYGGPTDLWGTTTLTPAIINSAGFGVVLSAERQNQGNSDRSAFVDYMQIAVYYSSGGTTVVDCGAGTPETVYGDSITCVATVTGTAGVTPTGTVAWTTGGSGTFSPTSCTLAGSAGVATCQVSYTPTGVGTGIHLITATYGGDVSYASSIGSQNLSVAPRPASVAPDTASKTYGDPDPTLAGTLTGFLVGDNVTATYSREAGETVLGSPYLISATLSPTGVLVNYTITYYTASFTITKATPTCVITPYHVTYDRDSHAATGACIGVMYETLVGLDLSGTTHTAVGLYTADPWTFTDVTGNYDNASGVVSNAITPVLITVTADAKTKRIGEADPVLTYQVTSGSLLSGDEFNGQLTRTLGEAAGSYPILQGTLALPDYYQITYVGATLTITSYLNWYPIIFN